jgi:hypothetical protein
MFNVWYEINDDNSNKCILEKNPSTCYITLWKLIYNNLNTIDNNINANNNMQIDNDNNNIDNNNVNNINNSKSTQSKFTSSQLSNKNYNKKANLIEKYSKFDFNIKKHNQSTFKHDTTSTYTKRIY